MYLEHVNDGGLMPDKAAAKHMKKTARPANEPKTPQVRDPPDEMALDVANELSFPASDPISVSDITRIEKAPETASAAYEHQNIHAVKKAKAKTSHKQHR